MKNFYKLGYKEMRMKNKLFYTKRWLLGFIVTMLVFTLCSRSIIYFLMPKVRVEKVGSGRVVEKKEVTDIEAIYSDKEYIRIPMEMEQDLYIEEILVYEGKAVEKGEPLMIFNMEDCNVLSAKLQEQLIEIDRQKQQYVLQKEQIEQEYQEQLAVLQKQKEEPPEVSEYNAELLKIELEQDAKRRELQVLNKQAEANELLYKENLISEKEVLDSRARQRRLLDELALLEMQHVELEEKKEVDYEKEYRQFETREQERENRIRQIEREKDKNLLNLTSWETLEIQHEQLKILHNNLAGILNNGVLVASIDGVIGSINVEDNTYYKGKEVLLEIIPVSSDVKWRIAIDQNEKEFWEKVNEINLVQDGKEIPLQMLGIRQEESENFVYFQTNEDITFHEQENMRIVAIAQSEIYNALIPSSALVGDKVFVLREEERGLWGNYYYVDEVQVNIGRANVNKVGIKSGLSEGMPLVVYWDREIKDKDRVMLEIR